MISIELMRNSPIIRQADQETILEGAKKTLFRLLVLSKGKTVQKSRIASIKNTDIDAVSSKVRDLRNGLGEFGDLIGNTRGAGYSFDLSGCEVDAFKFQNAAEALSNGNVDWECGSLSVAQATSEYSRLEKVRSSWRANPADGLPTNEFFFAPTFDRYYETVETRLVFSMLHTRDFDAIRDAIAIMAKMKRQGQTDHRLSIWLMLAYDAIGAGGKVNAVRNRETTEYPGSEPPAVIEETWRQVVNQEIENPFRPEPGLKALASSATQAVSDPKAGVVEELCHEIGITSAYEMQLEGSKLTPAECVGRAKTRLWFSGVLASKWVMDPAIRSQFDSLLSKFKETGADAKFLIIDPDSDAFERLKDIRQGNLSAESVVHLKRLNEKHDNLQVRMYSSLPSFRIVLINEDVVSFSPYLLAADPYLRSRRGWKAPHVVLDPMAPYPLAEAFELLFQETWMNARPLEKG